ncbi:transposase InsO family protein [Paraburkholderia sp. CI3]
MRDAMLAAVAQQFGTGQVAPSIEWLTDNGSAYVDHRTRSFARELALESLTTRHVLRRAMAWSNRS